jgi:putative phosphoribosyl transferase
MDSVSHEPEARVHILSHNNEPFRDREQAGQLLGKELGELKGKNAVVLGIPRGGIVVARELALRIDADMDVVLSRKLGAPGQSELAMGALSENGAIFLNTEVVRELGVADREIEREKALQMAEIQRRSQLIRNVLPKTPLKERIVLVTDDGVATGATMQAALWAARQEGPRRLMVAVPVASAEALDRLSADADEIICLRQPPFFYAVGQFYVQFYQVEDMDVLRILKDEVRRREKGRPSTT